MKAWVAAVIGMTLALIARKRLLSDGEKSWLERVNSVGPQREPEWSHRDREYCRKVMERMREGDACEHPPLYRRAV